MNPQGADLLSQLRDIHAAPAAPWWPPAPGWWLVAVILALVLAWCLRRAWRYLRAYQRRRRLARFVDRVADGIDAETQPQHFLAALNRIFKFVAMEAFPESHCAALQGHEWAAFLQTKIGAAEHAEQLIVLAAGPYQPRPEFDHAALIRLARLWIRRYG